MFLRKANSKWIVRTPAKLNVYLSIQGKRPDGYHELQTLMVPIQLFDHLTFQPLPGEDSSGSGIRFQLVPPRSLQSPLDLTESARCYDVPGDETNLVVRAVAELRRRTGCTRRAEVTLTKRIPAGAGLGGGSSDAAAALVTANAAWDLGHTPRELAEIAASIGSDVPFFLSGRAAIGSGRGEIVTPLESRTRLHAILVTPQERLSAAEVYAAVREGDHAGNGAASGRFEQMVWAFLAGNVGLMRRLLCNGLERAAVSLRPELAGLKASMQRLSGGGVLMTGSGSSFFCLCRTARHARSGAAYLNSLGLPTAMAAASYG